MPASKLRAWVLDVLADEGYIRGYEKVTGATATRPRDQPEVLRRRAGHPRDEAGLEARPPGLCHGVKDIPQVRQGLGVSIVSTPKGVMSDARRAPANVGGEVLCTVF
jgi:small subunit ribosomal protein S8